MTITTPKQLVRALEKHGSLKAVARQTNTGWKKVHALYDEALIQQLIEPIRPGRKTREHIAEVKNGDYKPQRRRPRRGGKIKAMRTKKLAPLPHKGKIHRYFFTCAQNNTNLHEGFWTNLQALAKHYDARICVSRFSYYKDGSGDKAAWMNNERFKAVRDFKWDDRLTPFLMDQRMEVAPGLVFCGEANESPTTANPLAGKKVLTGRKSMILPHTTIGLEPVAAMKGEGTKLNFTTGTVTLRNYIQRAAGLKAEFHHAYGALLIEVDSEGNWWPHQINADSTGTIYHLTLRVKDGEVTDGHRIKALTGGDVHVDNIDPEVDAATWGEGGLVDMLQPEYQFIHDVLDFSRRGHHNIKNSHVMHLRYIEHKESVRTEFDDVGKFLEHAARPFTKTIVVNSNHDRHPERWLTEVDGRKDPVNAEFWSALNDAVFKWQRVNGVKADVLVEGMKLVGWTSKLKKLGVSFLPEDESFIICKDAGGGIECGLHFDRGADGARGSARAIANSGRKANGGHSHSPRITGGAYQGGTSSKRRLEYVHGLSSHTHAHIITYQNGKRSIAFFWAGRFFA